MTIRWLGERVLAILVPLILAGALIAAPAGTAVNAATHADAGTRLWTALYKGSNGVGQATAIAASPDGSTVFVTGLNGDTGGQEYYGTVAYNETTGARLWTASYRGPTGTSGAAAITVSPDGSTVFVTGSAGSNGSQVYATVAYDAATGAQLWVATYTPAGAAFAGSVVVSPDGSTVFVGGDAEINGGAEYAIVAYDASTGSMRWSAVYGGQGGAFYSGATLTVSPDGSSLFATGTDNESDTARKWVTVAYATGTGARQWVVSYTNPTTGKGGYARSIAVSPDGSDVFVTGSTVVKVNSSGYPPVAYSDATVAYDADTGEQLWTASYSGPFGGGPDTAGNSVAVSPDGSTVFITGTSAASATEALTAYATVAYDADTGAQLWAARYNGPTRESSPTQLVVSPDGSRVFVTGSTVKVFHHVGEYQYATLAYDAATGAGLWHRLYPDSARGVGGGQGIAESPGGSAVFVTGTVAVSGVDHYGTVAYSTG